MDIIFVKPGEYKNDDKNIIVTDKDVKKGKVFPVVEKNYVSYVKKGLAVLAKEIKADEPKKELGTDINNMTVPQLEEFAASLEPVIDISEAKNKAEKLEIISTEIDIRKAVLEATNTDD